MTEPIAFTVTRYKCPTCNRFSRSSKTRVREHTARCWYNPDAHGCKTCKHFEPPTHEDPDWCNAGVSLEGRPRCTKCYGFETEPCPHCGGDNEEVRPGPIIGCDKWEAADGR